MFVSLGEILSGKYFGPTEGRADRSAIAFQIWRRSMRSISPWFLPRCLSLGRKHNPRGEGLIHLCSLVSMTAWPVASISAPANATNHGKDSIVFEGDTNV